MSTVAKKYSKIMNKKGIKNKKYNTIIITC